MLVFDLMHGHGSIAGSACTAACASSNTLGSMPITAQAHCSYTAKHAFSKDLIM